MKVDGDLKSASYMYADKTDGGMSDNSSVNGKSQDNKVKEGGSVFAGDLNLGIDPVEEKRKKAREMAMDLLRDVNEREQAFDEEVASRERRARGLLEENDEHKKILNDIGKEKDNLRELYGVSEGSQEDEELALLRKSRDAQKNPLIELSDEEKQKVGEIYARGLTEYQKEALRLDANEEEYKKKIEDNDKERLQELAIVRGMKLEHLKQHDMVDAGKQGEKILKAANDEIIGMLRGDVKDNIDKKVEEEKEKAKEDKKEKEELEDKIEAAKSDTDYEKYIREKREEREREKMYKIGSTMDQVNQVREGDTVPDTGKSLNQVVNELMLSTEDIKGLVVDESM